MIFMIMFVILGVFLAVTRKYDSESWVVARICVWVILLVAFIVSIAFSGIPSEKWVDPLEVPIIQMKEAVNGISGSGSFLGWILKGGEPVYVVFEKWEHGAIRTFLNQSNTWIAETDDEPYVQYKQYKQYYKKSLTLPFMWFCKEKTCYITKNAVIYVPRGTIVEKIDNI